MNMIKIKGILLLLDIRGQEMSSSMEKDEWLIISFFLAGETVATQCEH